jgi:hypothetical protein
LKPAFSYYVFVFFFLQGFPCALSQLIWSSSDSIYDPEFVQVKWILVSESIPIKTCPYHGCFYSRWSPQLIAKLVLYFGIVVSFYMFLWFMVFINVCKPTNIPR